MLLVINYRQFLSVAFKFPHDSAWLIYQWHNPGILCLSCHVLALLHSLSHNYRALEGEEGLVQCLLFSLMINKPETVFVIVVDSEHILAKTVDNLSLLLS